MSIRRCPECNLKMSASLADCPHCGFCCKAENRIQYQQALEKRRLINREINRKSAKLHLVWLVIFILVLLLASGYHGAFR